MKIVVGYDGSEPAQRALQRASELAKAGDSVTVVSATDATVMKGGVAPGAAKVEARKLALEEASAVLSSKGLTVQTEAAEGDPGDAIMARAENVGADVIVVGTRGLNAAQRLVLGSVSTKLIHHAPCDVLVVR